MSDSESEQDVKKLIYVLPRIRLSGTAFGQNSFAVSKANFFPDEQNTWEDVLKLPRPEWLDIYREFPGVDGDAELQPAHGTLVFSDDEDWLKLHIGRLLAIVYVMGERKWQTPTDAFRYSSFLASEQPHDMVELFTKSGGKIEDLRSLQLLPPLELRGANVNFRVALTDDRNAELIRRFDQNPYDRLGAACYQLFRSQFDDPFFAPPQQDAAAFCACLEAAFDISGPDYAKTLTDELQALYGEHRDFARWIKGLYSERSVFNHGVAIDPDHGSSDDREVAQAEYRERNLSWDLLRNLCLDVIREQLQDSIDAESRKLGQLMNPVRDMLRQFFCSEEIWTRMSKPLTDTESTQTILSLTGPAHDDFISLCCEFLNGHRWEAMKGKADRKKVSQALMTVAAIFGEHGKRKKDNEDVESAHELFEAAKADDEDRVRKWARSHTPWKTLPAQQLDDAAKAVACHIAQFFGS